MYSLRMSYISATFISLFYKDFNTLWNYSQFGSRNPFKLGVIRYNKCKSVSRTRNSYYLASTNSWKIKIDSSGDIELPKAALPKGVGIIYSSFIIIKLLNYKYDNTWSENLKMHFLHEVFVLSMSRNFTTSNWSMNSIESCKSSQKLQFSCLVSWYSKVELRKLLISDTLCTAWLATISNKHFISLLPESTLYN